ncbi:flagellar protein G [Halobacteriales archaeon SW_10_68_16]|jgi:flagellar protein FlaG|nr:MAG: flagellar protein G [Halobacteriales archaeon SW_10_68_16]
MASVSVSHLILFIASMLIAASVAGVFTSSVDRLSGAIDDQGVQVSDDVRTDVEIISDNGTGACVYDCDGNDNLTLHIKNTGTTTLPAESDQMDVFVNGQFQGESSVSVQVVGDADRWRPGEVVRVNVSVDRSQLRTDNRAKVIVNGDEEVFEFRTPGIA